ncbi:outer membrane protein assembly factor BamA [Thermodesulfobacteriota bacterium]
MLKRIVLFFVMGLCFLPVPVFSQQGPQVLILPFEILAQKKGDYLQTEIPKVIRNQLKLEGAVIVGEGSDANALLKQKDIPVGNIRKLGIKAGADYVVWGSLTWIGKKFSLDAKMAETFGDARPCFFFKEGEGIENLLGSVKELSRDIGLKLFKREKVAKVEIQGVQRIEGDAIREVIKTKPGDVYLARSLSADLKAVYAMGYFDDIRIESEDSPEGKIIVFKVTEKPTIRRIEVSHNKVYKDEEIVEALSIKTGSILNAFQVQQNIERIKGLYKEKNYHNIKVDYQIHPTQQNQADLEFILDEGSKLRVTKIHIAGNKAYDDKKIKKLMETSEKGFFFWLTDSGELNTDDLNQDVAKLSAFYHNSGYIQAKVSDPQIDYQKDRIEITIKIEEGQQYEVGEVNVAGDLIFSPEELKKKLKIVEEKHFNREVLRKDVLTLTDLYSDEGYAYADISPLVKKNEKALTVDITYQIDKRKLVYFERIIIGGNTKTRDKVIRRQLKVYEQELYKGAALKKGVRNLYRLDYFEDVKVNTSKGSADDKMILNIDVTEKPTGTFSFGGGYSSIETVFVQGAINQRNLFGKGQIAQLKAELGGRSSRYTISFTEPWLFDIPLSAGSDLYNWDYDYDTYVKSSLGGRLRFSYPVFEYTRVRLIYTYDRADIKDVTADASQDIKDLEGINLTSSIYTGIHYDSRDRAINATEGSEHRIGLEYAGLGGNIGFTKITGKTGWYIPLFWTTIGFVHAKTGFVFEQSGMMLPDYEKFYLGGPNSVRGFGFQDIHLVDEDGAKIGGDKFIQFNLEYIIPLIKKAGLVGVLFTDAGQVYAKDEDMGFDDLRHSVGYGFRWYSPMGPMRLEWGMIVDPRPGEDTDGRWEFSIGGAF